MTFHSFHNETHLYFVTATVCGWKAIFAQAKYASIVLDSLAWLRQNDRMLLQTYVLMPSHLHMIVKPRDLSIGDLLQDFGSFTAHTMIRVLRENRETGLLNYFHEHRRDARHEHSIWQDIQAMSGNGSKHQTPPRTAARAWLTAGESMANSMLTACSQRRGRHRYPSPLPAPSPALLSTLAHCRIPSAVSPQDAAEDGG